MKTLFFIFLGVVVTHCGKYGPPVKRNLSLDEVKLISKKSKEPREPRLMNQDRYTISEEERLLVRYGRMAKDANEWVVDKEKGAFLYLHFPDKAQEAVALENLKLCPLKKNWMMLATWEKAYPHQNDQGKWKTPGGDFSDDECLELQRAKDKSLVYDITQWTLDNPLARNENFGFILVSKVPVTLFGDAKPSLSPQIEVHRLISVFDPIKAKE